MPLMTSTYTPPFLFKNRHIQSIFPKLFRKITNVTYKRERIYTPDNDFIDLDWSETKSNNLVVLVPGLESSSKSINILGMVSAFNKRLWSAVVYNPRGLSGEINNRLIQYHAGKTDDFNCAIQYLVRHYSYTKIVIVGFSFGGSVIIKYLSEKRNTLPGLIKKAACASVPFDLHATAKKLDTTLYFKYFRKKFKKNVLLKMKKFPKEFNIKNWRHIKTFARYVERYVTPYNEFENAVDYWEKTSAKNYIQAITIPVLIINAKDDPFLTEISYPIKEAKTNKNLYLELPDYGGHNGFILFNKEHEYYLEKRFCEFMINDL